MTAAGERRTGSGRRASGRACARTAAAAALVAAATLVAGCASVSLDVPYYWQSARGQFDLIRRAQPIAEVLADPATQPWLRERLQAAREIREYASRSLGLPRNASYTRYADLHRPFVVWNVFAAPELSLQLREWCFPVAGCVSYRGYFHRDDAERYAGELRSQGWDVYVAGVPAYSTLGWFDDPLLSTFIRYPEGELARLVFHELAHQLLYVKGDTTFNESFATTVEEVGVDRWLAHRDDPAVTAEYRRFDARRRQFLALVARHRAALQAIYDGPGDAASRRAAKAAELAALHADYRTLKASWGGYAGYDRWFAQPTTNAQLASLATYTQWVPAFRALLAENGGRLDRFYAAVRRLAAEPQRERDARLAALAEQTMIGKAG